MNKPSSFNANTGSFDIYYSIHGLRRSLDYLREPGSIGIGSILLHFLRLSLCQAFLDLISPTLYKPFSFHATHPLRTSNHDLAIRFDLGRDGFAVTLYDLIRHIHTLISSTKNGWPFDHPTLSFYRTQSAPVNYDFFRKKRISLLHQFRVFQELFNAYFSFNIPSCKSAKNPLLYKHKE